jgi:hypothetical protein
VHIDPVTFTAAHLVIYTSLRNALFEFLNQAALADGRKGIKGAAA